MAGKFVLKKSRTGQFQFNLHATNGRVILTSEQYKTRAAAMNGIKSVQKNSGDDKRFDRRTAKNGKTYFCLCARNGEVIGKAGMWERPEIGFFVAPEHQRQGIATEALNAVIRHLFQTYHLGRLTADVDPRNTPSIMLLKNLGFVETGRAKASIQILGEWCDSVYLALHRA